jgi:alpha-ketoglutarate-dependent taurine dioxygenase
MNEMLHPDSGELPCMIPLEEMTTSEFIRYYRENTAYIESSLLQYGAVKFSGVQIASLEDFQYIVDSVSSRFLPYVDGNSPRIKLSGNVYTSTEYDHTQKITMHNELSYSAKWPNKLFFSCLVPAGTGGETLLADSRKIFKIMDRAIVGEVRKRGITYIRNLHGGDGMGPSWQDTFETDDKHQLETYCRSYSIGLEWRENNCVRLIQPAKGIGRHRQTGEELWFNQIDQFHPVQLGEDIYEGLMAVYEDPADFPMYVRFGDGGEISGDFVREILSTIEKVTIAPVWQKNEFLLIDNELVCHGRNPYSGARKVLVSMSE